MILHGEAFRGRHTPEYRAWRNMHARCLEPTHGSYRKYRELGVTICDAWLHDFPAFLAHVGRRPSPKHSIERIDNWRGYEPGNVRWATRQEQNLNTRRNRLLDVNDKRISLKQACDTLATPMSTFRYHFMPYGVR